MRKSNEEIQWSAKKRSEVAKNRRKISKHTHSNRRRRQLRESERKDEVNVYEKRKKKAIHQPGQRKTAPRIASASNQLTIFQ